MHVIRLFNDAKAVLIEPPDLTVAVPFCDVVVGHIRGMKSVIEKAELIVYTDGLDIKLLQFNKRQKTQKKKQKKVKLK